MDKPKRLRCASWKLLLPALLVLLCCCLDLAEGGRMVIPRRILQSSIGGFGWFLILAGIVILICTAVFLYFSFHKGNLESSSEKAGTMDVEFGKSSSEKSTPTPPSRTGWVPPPLPPVPDFVPEDFNLEEVQMMTQDWDPRCLLEDAGHSNVYLGTPNEHVRELLSKISMDSRAKKVVIKKAKKQARGDEVKFKQEVKLLAETRHPNMVPFIGCCSASMEQILVFEYLSDGPLSDWLRPKPNTPRSPLDFQTRLGIAIDIAEALKFMHAQSRVHRDVKSDTILMRRQTVEGHERGFVFRGLLGGLGLVKHMSQSAMRARKEKIRKNLDPEFYSSMKVDPKTDVYSFGIVMLEMLTAKAMEFEDPAAFDANAPPLLLTVWAPAVIKEKNIGAAIDPRLGLKENELKLAVAFADIAFKALVPTRKERPDINKVLKMLLDLRTKVPY